MTIRVVWNTNMITVNDADVEFRENEAVITAHKRRDLIMDCIESGLPFHTMGDDLVMVIDIMDIHSMDVE